MFGIKDIKADIQMLRTQIGEVAESIEGMNSILLDFAENNMTIKEIATMLKDCFKEHTEQIDDKIERLSKMLVKFISLQEEIQKKDKKAK